MCLFNHNRFSRRPMTTKYRWLIKGNADIQRHENPRAINVETPVENIIGSSCFDATKKNRNKNKKDNSFRLLLVHYIV